MRLKKDTKNLFTYLFGPNSLDNKVALISFSDNSSILSELTNDKTALEAIVDNINVGGNTNYNAAYKNVERLLDDYTYDGTRDVSVLFLTDGYPNVEASNQVTTFELLKNKYPFIRVDGIQYEMGDSIIKEIRDDMLLLMDGKKNAGGRVGQERMLHFKKKRDKIITFQ